jgi:hypothetical protein
VVIATTLVTMGGGPVDAQIELECRGGFFEAGKQANFRPMEQTLGDFTATMLFEANAGNRPPFRAGTSRDEWGSYSVSVILDPQSVARSADFFWGIEHVGGIYGTQDNYRQHVILRLRRESGETWWRLWFDDSPAMEITDFPTMSSGPRLVSAEPFGADLEPGIVRLVFRSHGFERRNGALADRYTNRTVLIDLQGPDPEVIADVRCTGFSDVDASSRCVRDDSVGGFTCIDKAVLEVPWEGRRVVDGHYGIGSLQSVSRELQDIGGLVQRLFAVAESLSTSQSVDPPSIRGAGKVRHLATIGRNCSSGHGHLLAISRASPHFGSLFVIVWQDAAGTISLRSLKPRGDPPDGYLASAEDLHVTWKNRVRRPWMSPRSTSRLSIENVDCLSTGDVETFRIAESEGEGSASYLIPINRTGEGAIFVLSASFRAHGWLWWQIDSASKIQCIGESRLELEIERENMRWQSGQDHRTEPECPTFLELTSSRRALLTLVEKPAPVGCEPRAPLMVTTMPGHGITVKPWKETLGGLE